VFLDPYLATGRLTYALEHDFADASSYFLVVPERAQRVRREVQQFREWLLAAAAST
jgi:DNA-binding transcriptional LysR family regulator